MTEQYATRTAPTLADAGSPPEASRWPSPDEVWEAAEARLDWPLERGVNIAHESCDRWARDRGRLALIVVDSVGDSERWTFADLERASKRVARTLHEGGIRRGDRIAGVLSRQIETWLVALAAWRMGAVYVPLFAGFGAGALAERLKRARPELVVVDHRFRHALAGAQELLPHEVRVYTVAGERGVGVRHGDHSFWDEVERRPAEFETVVTSKDDPAILMFSSGTTGQPKGCIMPHGIAVAAWPFTHYMLGLTAKDMFFTGADPGWSYGLLTTGTAVWALGLPRVMYTGDFDPDVWLDLIENERVTFMAAAPSAYRKLVEKAERRGGIPAAVRGATSAGEPLDAPLAVRWRALTGHDIRDAYGLSEMAMVLGNAAHDTRPVLPGALNDVLPPFEIELVDDEGVPSDDQGILAIRRPRYSVTAGYLEQQELWDARWKGDLFVTGDIVRRDEEGRYWFVGRDDDVIVTSGYNVGPSEVENVLLDHPEIVDAAAVAADDPSRGKVVRAVVVQSGNTPLGQLTKELQDAVRARIGRHAYPRIVDLVDELPRTETGKLKRKELRT